MNDLKEVIEKITDTIDDAGRLYGERWDSALVQHSPGNNSHAITSEHTQAVVVSAADDSRHSSWLCDYLEAVSPANVRLLLAAMRPARVIVADLSDEDLKAFERDLAASRPDGIIVTPRQQPEPVAWQCLRKGPGRFVVTLERAVADEWARKGWPVRALCECNSQSAFVSATDYLRDRAKDPE